MNREQIDSLCEKGILGLVASVLAIGPLLLGSVDYSSQALLLGLTLLAAALWGIRIWCQKRFRVFWPPVCWAALAFLVYCAARYFQAEVEYPARKELLRGAVYFLLFLIVLQNLNKQDHCIVLVFTLATVAMVLSFYALYQSKLMTSSPWVWNWMKPDHFIGRGSGSYICPNHFAGFVEMVIPLGLAFTITSRMGHIPRLFLGYCALASIAGLASSFSRGGWIAGAFGVMAFFGVILRHPRYRKPVLLSLMVLIGIGTFVFQKAEWMQSRFQNMTEGGSVDDVTIRIAIWKAANSMWKDHFWLGMGPAQFDEQFPQYRPRPIQWRPEYVHNDYLNALVDYGTIGLGLIALFLVLFLYGIFKTLNQIDRNSGDFGSITSNRLAMTLGGFASFAAIAVHSLVDFNMYIPANAVTLIVIMALVTAQYRYAANRTWSYPGIPGKAALTLLLIMLASFALPEGFRQYREWRALKEARLSKHWREEVEALEKAYAVEPGNYQTPLRIGKIYLDQGLKGESGYAEQIEKSLQWLDRSAALNPVSRHAFLYQGMGRDWIGRHQEAERSFQKAIDLDPNNHYSWALFGEHYCWTEEYFKARRCILRSLDIWPWGNQRALVYRTVIEDRLREQGFFQ